VLDAKRELVTEASIETIDVDCDEAFATFTKFALSCEDGVDGFETNPYAACTAPEIVQEPVDIITAR